jgi:hypothetical protein
MTSAINTNGINVNYPIPGVNNSSQGFRDNFAAIKGDLNTAANEITDLQNNVVLKQALDGTLLNNDMANTLISNASTRGFRASTFNLGNAISGTLIVNASLGDVQYGTITGNTTIQFTGWAPIGTQSNVELQLSVANNLAVISLPTEVKIDGAYGTETVENFANVANIPTLTIPYDTTRMDYRFSTLDCGNTITIEPYNRPRQTTQVQQRIPSPIGKQGDVVGTFSVDPTTSVAFATCTATNGTYDFITCDSTSGFYLDMPVVFTGNTFGGIIAGATYYVRQVLTSTTFTISSAPGTNTGPDDLVNLTTSTGIMYVNPISYMYNCTGSYDGNVIIKYASNTNVVTTTVTGTNTSSTGNTITVSSTSGFVVGYPVAFSGTLSNTFITATYSPSNVLTVASTANMVVGGRIAVTGNVFGGLLANIYYITNIYPGNSNITLSNTFGGGNITLSTATGNCDATFNGIMGGLLTGTDYYVQSIDPTIIAGNFNVGQQYEIVDVGSTNWTAINASSNTSGVTFIANGVGSGTGTATALNQFTVSANSPGGAPVALVDENGSMNVTAVTDYTITLNSTSNVNVNSPIEFSGNMFGGIVSDKIYYVSNVTSGTDISISETINNGLAGQKLPLFTANGNVIANITTSGTPIWKSVVFKPYNSSEDSSIVNNLTVYGDANIIGNTTLVNVSANLYTGNFSGNVAAFNLTVSNLANFTALSQLKIAGGTSGYFLQTDGAGNLSWVAGTVSGTTTAPGGVNTQVQFNDAGTIQGNANLTFDKTTGTLSVGNALSVTGNTNSGNISVTANITAGNITLSSNIVANNFTTTTGAVTAPIIQNGTSNVTITNNGNITLYISGNGTARFTATSTGVVANGTLTVSGNANIGNIYSTSGTFAGPIQGVTTLTANSNISTTSSGSILSNNFVFTGVTTGITANGTSQAAGTVLVKEFNVVSTVTGTNYSVVLPASVAGMKVMIRNNSGNTLYVYPASGSAINLLATNIAYQQNANTTNEFYCTSTTQWYTLV